MASLHPGNQASTNEVNAGMMIEPVGRNNKEGEPYETDQSSNDSTKRRAFPG
jgi:hypothetical protein